MDFGQPFGIASDNITTMGEAEVYDHHEKAGNEGDICKHAPLIAALAQTVACTARREEH